MWAPRWHSAVWASDPGTSAVLPAARRRKVLVVIEAAFIALLNVAVTVVLSGTPVAPGAGACAVRSEERRVGKVRRASAARAVPLEPRAAGYKAAVETV